MYLLKLPLPVIIGWLIFSILGLSVIAVFFSRRRERTVLQNMTFFMLALIWWQVTYVMELLAAGMAMKMFWCKMQFLGLVSMPFLWMMAVLAYCNRREDSKLVKTGWVVFLSLTIVILLTDDMFHLFHTIPSMVFDNGVALIDYGYGIWYFMVFLPITFGLFGGSVYILLQYAKNVTEPLYKKQINTLISVVVLNLLASAFYMFDIYLVNGIENISFSLPLTSLITFTALRKLNLFELIPLANHLIIKNLNDGVVVVNEHCRLIFFNPYMNRILPEISSAKIGEPFYCRLNGQDFTMESCLQHLVESKKIEFSVDVEGGGRHFELRQSPIRNDGEFVGTIFHFRDVTDMVQLNKQLQFVAHHDALTGLLNRYSFFEQAEYQFNLAQRDKNLLGIMMLDFDNFKNINDQHGHLMGDRVLVEVAKTCQQAIRAMDVVARFGGDEFIFLIGGLDEKNFAKAQEEFDRIVNRLSAALMEIVIDVNIHPEVSIGAALYDPNHPVQNLGELIEQADQHLYQQKNAV